MHTWRLPSPTTILLYIASPLSLLYFPFIFIFTPSPPPFFFFFFFSSLLRQFAAHRRRLSFHSPLGFSLFFIRLVSFCSIVYVYAFFFSLLFNAFKQNVECDDFRFLRIVVFCYLQVSTISFCHFCLSSTELSAPFSSCTYSPSFPFFCFTFSVFLSLACFSISPYSSLFLSFLLLP